MTLSDLEAEQALLGSMLANNRVYLVADYLAADHFADPINGRIFEIVTRQIEAGQLTDAVTVKHQCEHSGVLEEIGGTEYLVQLLRAATNLRKAQEHARTIHDLWIRRELIQLAETMKINATVSQLTCREQINAVGGVLARITKENRPGPLLFVPPNFETPDWIERQQMLEITEWIERIRNHQWLSPYEMEFLDSIDKRLWNNRLRFQLTEKQLDVLNKTASRLTELEGRATRAYQQARLMRGDPNLSAQEELDLTRCEAGLRAGAWPGPIADQVFEIAARLERMTAGSCSGENGDDDPAPLLPPDEEIDPAPSDPVAPGLPVVPVNVGGDGWGAIEQPSDLWKVYWWTSRYVAEIKELFSLPSARGLASRAGPARLQNPCESCGGSIIVRNRTHYHGYMNPMSIRGAVLLCDPCYGAGPAAWRDELRKRHEHARARWQDVMRGASG